MNDYSFKVATQGFFFSGRIDRCGLCNITNTQIKHSKQNIPAAAR